VGAALSGRLAGRVCLITGAARGIGRAYAVRFGEEGARVAVSDVLPLDETVAELPEGSLAVTGDITTRAEAEAIVAATVEEFGRLDVLINNAAYYGGMTLAPFDEISEVDWDRAFAVNVKGLWNMCVAASRPMRAQGSGSIVNVTSNVIFMGKPNFLHYVASKGAVWAMTNALSRELAGTGVVVNAIAPGYTITAATREMGDPDVVRRLEDEIVAAQSVKRLLDVDDLTGTAVFLASDDAAMLTGQTLTVDGGVITR
jgi:3-oxoacyl-[acyl-carrier protein] reductase